MKGSKEEPRSSQKRKLSDSATHHSDPKRRGLEPDDSRGQIDKWYGSNHPDILLSFENRPFRFSQTDKTRISCDLCGSDVTFRSINDLAFHLTLIHYKDEITAKISAPYQCSFCKYKPFEAETNEQKAENMLIHVGVDEGVALDLYQRQSATQSASPPAKTSSEARQCLICGSSLNNENSFLRHLTLRHYYEKLETELPAKAPFRCSFVECQVEKMTSHTLILHVGCEHFLSLELYHKEFPPDQKVPQPMSASAKQRNPPPEPSSSTTEKKNSSKSRKISPVDTFPCPICHMKNMGTSKQRDLHIFSIHLFKHMPSQAPFKCRKCGQHFKEKGLLFKHFRANHWKWAEDGSPLPSQSKAQSQPKSNPNSHQKTDAAEPRGSESSRSTTLQEPVTTETALSARQRMQIQWESTSIDGQKLKMNEMNQAMQKLRDEHKEAMSKKTKEFEQWINKKEDALDKKEEERKALEAKVQESLLTQADLKKQLEQAKSHVSSYKTSLDDTKAKLEEVNKEVKSKVNNNLILQLSVEELQKKVNSTKTLLADKDSSVKTHQDKLESLEMALSEKTDEATELQRKADFEKRELEKKLARLEKQAEFRDNKLEKLQTEKKNLVKERKESEAALKAKIEALKKEVVTLKSKKDVGSTDQSTSGSHFEELYKSTRCEVDLLQTERNSLLDSLERTQRTLYEYDEHLIPEKNAKIKDLQSSLEDTITNLDEAMQKLKEHKGLDKVKREQAKTIKTLQNTLKDWEERQFNSVKLIAGLQKENQDLITKIKDSMMCSDSKELQDLKGVCYSLERDVRKSRLDSDLAEQERAKAIAILEARNEELDTLRSKNLELEVTCRSLERKLRQSSVAGSNQQLLQEEVENKSGEIRHLQRTLHDLKQQMITLRSQNDDLKANLMSVSKPRTKGVVASATCVDASAKHIVIDEDTEANETKEEVSTSPLHSMEDPLAPKSWDYSNSNLSGYGVTASTSIIDYSQKHVKERRKDLDENGDHLCSLCFRYDPPLANAGPNPIKTDWVGCDCDRFVKLCQLLRHITFFSLQMVSQTLHRTRSFYQQLLLQVSQEKVSDQIQVTSL